MTQLARFTIDAEQVYREIAKMGQASKNLSNSANTAVPPPPQPFVPSAYKATPAASTSAVSVEKAIADMARIDAVYRQQIARAEAAGAISSKQATQLRQETTTALTGNPDLNKRTAANLVPLGGLIGEEGQAGLYRKERAAAERDLKGLTDKEFQAKANELLAQNEINAATKQEAAASKVSAEIAEENVLSAKDVAKAQRDKAQAIRREIVKLEGVLNLPTTGGADAASIAELEAYKNSLAGQARSIRLDEQNRAQKAMDARITQGKLHGNTPSTFIPTTWLDQDARAEGNTRAAERSVAVKYGQEKQRAYLEQVQYNEVFRKQWAEEAAMREARLGLEKKLYNEELANVANRQTGATYRDAIVGGKVAETVEDSLQKESLAANSNYTAAKARAARATQLEAAKIAEINAGNEAYIQSKVRAAAAANREALSILENTTEAQIAQAGELAAARNIQGVKRNIARLDIEMSEQNLRLKAQERVLQKEYNTALNRKIAQELAARGASRLEVSQALQGHGTGVGGGPQTAGGLFGGGLLNTVKYAVPSILLFGAASGLAESMKQAQELQLTFAKLEAQAKSLGPEASGSVDQLKESILSIAAESGYASTEVADLAFQFQGAFGEDTQKVIQETEAAVKAVVVTGLTLTETIDAFTAITQSFKGSGVSIEDVTDTALGLQEQFGVLAKETIAFASDLAPVGAQIGLTAEKLETLGAVAQKYSGRSGAELAEAYGRILPSLQKNAVEIIGIFDAAGGTQASAGLTEAFATGQTGAALEELMRNYENLSKAQQNQIITQLGGRREAAALIPVLQNAGEYFDALEKSQENSGKANEYYARSQETLTRQLAALGEQLKQVGIAIFNGGLGQALSFLATSGSGLIDVFGALFNVLQGFNGALNNVPGTLLGIVVAMRLLAGAVTIASESFAFLGIAKSKDTAATVANTEANVANAASQGGVATANTGSAGAAGAGFFGSILANTRAGYQARTGPAIPALADGSIRTGNIPYVGDFSVIQKESVESAGKLRTFGSGISKAASGVGAFANALPTPLVVAGMVLAIGQLVSTINDLREGADKVRADLGEQILAPDTAAERQKKIDELRAAQGQYSAYDNFAAWASRGNTPGQSADVYEAQSLMGGNAAGLRNLLGDENIDRYRGALQNGPSFSQDELSELIKKLESGTATEEEALRGQSILKALQAADEQFYNDVVKPQVDAAQKKVDEANAGFKASSDKEQKDLDTLAGLDVGGLKNAIASGDASIGQALNSINENIDIYERLQAENPAALGEIEGANEKFIQLKKARAEILSKAAYEETQRALKLNELTGAAPGQREEFAVQQYEQLLRGGDLSDADETKVVDQLLEAKKALLAYKLENAKSLEEQAAIIAEGEKLNDPERTVLAADSIRNSPSFNKFVANQDDQIGKVLTEGGDAIANLMIAEGKTLKEATIAYLEAQIKQARANADIASMLQSSDQARVDAAKNELERLEGSGALQGEVDAAKKEFEAAVANQNANSEEAARQRATAEQGQAALDELNNQGIADAVGGDTLEDIVIPDKVTPEQTAAIEAAKKRRQAELSYAKALADGDSVAIAGLELSEANANMAAIAAVYDEGSVEYIEAAAQVLIASNALKKAAQARANSRYDYLKALAADDPVAVAQIEVQAAAAAVAQAGPDEIDAARARLVNAQRAVRDANRAVMDAYGSYLEQLASDDPLEQAGIAIQNAQRALSEAPAGTAEYYQAAQALDAAYKRQRDQEEALQDARFDYSAALVEGDPVKAAQVAQQKAAAQLARARNEAERLEAMAAKLSADRAMQDALTAIYDAQSNLLTASAEYVGDTIKASQIGLADAQRKLAEVQAKFARGEAGEADVINAKADVVRATAAQRDALIAQRKDDYAFQYEMGQITKSQYIQYLEGLKGLADGNTQIIRDLDRQIKALKDELGADNQYNLPTNLVLPTLYEARRLNQSVGPDGQGVGYQDNRQVDINIIVNNGMDVNQLQSILGDAIGNQRFGNQPRRY